MATQQKRDYYEVLGLDRSAAQEQIKQAYRQLAMKWHPDRNSSPDATDRFKEIAEAYAVLSDETKHRAYHTTGHAGVSERWSTEDIFRDFDFGDFFGGRMGDILSVFGDLFPGRAARASVRPQGADLRYDLHLTLDDAAKGGERVINVAAPELEVPKLITRTLPPGCHPREFATALLSVVKSYYLRLGAVPMARRLRCYRIEWSVVY